MRFNLYIEVINYNFNILIQICNKVVYRILKGFYYNYLLFFRSIEKQLYLKLLQSAQQQNGRIDKLEYSLQRLANSFELAFQNSR